MQVFRVVLLKIVFVSTLSTINFRIDAPKLFQLVQLGILIVGNTQDPLLHLLFFLLHKQQILLVVVARKWLGHIWPQKVVYLA